MFKNGMALWLGLVVLVTGCENTEEDSVEAAGPSRYEVSDEPLVTIGDELLGPAYALNQVMAATRLSDGRIVIANGGSSELRFYAEDGQHEVSVGGQGDGPGEYRGIYNLARLPGDTLLVASFRPGFTLVAPDGEFVDSEIIDQWSLRVPCRLGEGGFRPLPDRTFLMVLADNFYGPECPPSPGPIWRQSALIALWGVDSPTLDTLMIIPGVERNSPNYRVYGAHAISATSVDRLYANDTRSDTIHSWSLDGTDYRVLTHPFDEEPIPPEARTEDIRRWTDGAGEERVGNAYVYPDFYPRVARMLTDHSGNLWVMKYPRLTNPLLGAALNSVWGAATGPDPTEWAILNPLGQVVAHATLPLGLYPFEIGDGYILGINKDELDVQTVVVHRLKTSS